MLATNFLRLKTEKFLPTRDLIDAEFALNTDGGGGQLDDASGAPMLYRVQGAEKTYAVFDLTVRNPTGHSSFPRADNAIHELAEALTKLQGFQFPIPWNDWTIGGFREPSLVG